MSIVCGLLTIVVFSFLVLNTSRQITLALTVDAQKSKIHNLRAESCFYQRCLGCHTDDAAAPGSPVECRPSNWVTAEWIHNLGHPPPSTDSKIPIEYHCLKMVATPDDKTFGNTVDILRGCIPRVQVDSVCLALKAVERARGHSDARCFTCNRNNCNSAETLQTFSFHGLLATLLIYSLLG